MNCLTVAVLIWVTRGFRGRIGVLEWGRPFPHFAVFDEGRVWHYKARDANLPWWRQLWFAGDVVEMSTW